MFSRNEDKDNNFNSTSYKNINLKYLNQNGLELNRISPINKSRLASNVNKTSRIHNEVWVSTDLMQDMKHKTSVKNEQAGSIEPQPKIKFQRDDRKEETKKDNNWAETGDQQLYSNSNNSLKSIHNLHEEKRQKLLTKYSKENLIKSVKQPKAAPKAVQVREGSQRADPHSRKVRVRVIV